VGAQPHRGGEDLRIGSDPGRACTDALPRDHTGDGGAVVDGRLPTDRGLTVLAESAEVLGLADHTLEILMIGVHSGIDDGDLARSGPSHIEAERTFASGATPVGPAPTPCPAITPATAVPWWMVVFPPIGVLPSLPSPLKSLALLTTPSRSS